MYYPLHEVLHRDDLFLFLQSVCLHQHVKYLSQLLNWNSRIHYPQHEDWHRVSPSRVQLSRSLNQQKVYPCLQ